MRKLLRGIIIFFLVCVGLLLSQFKQDLPVDLLKKQYGNEHSAFFDFEGMDIHYRDEGSGEPILLLHGTGASMHTWEKWKDNLADSFRILRMDLPGFGITGPHPNANYGLNMYVELVESFRKMSDLDTFHLAGNSFGGRIALEYTLKHPGRVSSLILVDAAGYRLAEDKKPSMGFILARSPVWRKLIRWVTPKFLVRKSVLEVYGDDEKVTAEIVDRYFRFLLMEGNRQAFIDRANTKYENNLEAFKTITQPTLILWGEKDEWIPVSHAYKFKEDIPNSKLIIFPGAGHIPMEEIPEASVEAVRDFLEN